MSKSRQNKTLPQKPLALLIAAHPIWNVPPFVNAAKELGRNGYRVIVTGYQTTGLPNRERLAHGAWIFRLPLSSRRIGFTPLRRFFAVLEFLTRSNTITRRLRPDVLITFNDPGSIVQKLVPNRPGLTRVNWLLEYPELEMLNFFERTLHRFSASCWKLANIIVVPTRERLALHLALRPECANRKTLVVQNAPLNEPASQVAPSEGTLEALEYLKGAGPETIRIIYSGAIGNRYGADALIRAVGSFPQGVRLLLLGKKHPLADEEVNAALKETEFPGNIHWVDEIPYRELSHVLRAGDAGFGTYRGDSLNTRFSAPGKLYEYLKCGLVILSDDQCCIYAEAVASGCAAFFPKPVTDDGVRKAIADLLERRHEVAEMKAAARTLFETRLCMEEQIRPLLQQLPPPPPAEPVQNKLRVAEPARV